MDTKKRQPKRSTRKTPKPNKYRSKFEASVGHQLEELKREFEYETESIRFIQPSVQRLYKPDFIIKTRSGKTIYIEAKGLWTYEDRYKHLLIKQQHPDIDIRFVFQRASTRVSKGSRLTYRDVCEGRGRGIWSGVTWPYSELTIPKEWLSE